MPPPSASPADEPIDVTARIDFLEEKLTQLVTAIGTINDRAQRTEHHVERIADNLRRSSEQQQNLGKQVDKHIDSTDKITEAVKELANRKPGDDDMLSSMMTTDDEDKVRRYLMKNQPDLPINRFDPSRQADWESTVLSLSLIHI